MRCAGCANGPDARRAGGRGGAGGRRRRRRGAMRPRTHRKRRRRGREEPVAAAPEAGEPGRFARFRDAVAVRFAALDRRMPMDPRYLIAVLAAALIAAGVLTSGFGLFGDDGGAGAGRKARWREAKGVEVAVLNATQVDEGSVPIDAVAGSRPRSPTR